MRTTLAPASLPGGPLRHEDGLVLLGSCFSDGVGNRLRHAGHSVCMNPFGTLYNPASCSASIRRITNGDLMDATDLSWCKRQQHWFSFETSAVHAGETPEACIASVNAALVDAQARLQTAACLFLTLGSAWAYVRRDTGAIVANCHRQPQRDFERRLLGVDEVLTHVCAAVDAARALTPSIRVVLTVSPVRHLREGAVESSRSKAHLLAAVHAACELERGCSYVRDRHCMLLYARVGNTACSYKRVVDSARSLHARVRLHALTSAWRTVHALACARRTLHARSGARWAVGGRREATAAW